MNIEPVSESELHAYLDGELPPERWSAVEAHLAAYPASAERLATYRQQTEWLRETYLPTSQEALPERLRAACAEPVFRPAESHAGQPWQRIAAVLAIALLGAAAGWFGHAGYRNTATLASRPELPHLAAVAHAVYSPDARRPVEISAEQEDQLTKWLSKRLGTPVSPPHLGPLGYTLVGGRLLPGGKGPVAQFMYQDAGGQRLTLYVTTEYTDNRETGFRFAREGDINVFYWVDGQFGYALSGPQDRGEMARVANAVYGALTHH